MPSSITFEWLASNIQAVCNIQDGIANTPLIINGASSIDNGSQSFASFGSVIRQVSISSLNNLSAINFTITGYNQNVPISTTIAGPNAATVETTGTYFDTVTSVIPSANAAGVAIGSGDAGFTYWFNSNLYGFYATTFSANVISGTVDYTLQLTAENSTSLSNLYLSDPTSTMTNKAVSEIDYSLMPFTFARLALTASTGHLRFSVMQSQVPR